MRVSFFLPVLLIVLAACGPVAVVPTPTPAPSATPEPSATPAPSATPIPTATPVAAAGAIIRDAIERSATADNYQIDVTMAGSGALGGMSLGAEESELLDLVGEFAGDDYSFALQGFLASFLGADPARGLQAMQVDGVRYVRGPLSFIGAAEDAWYRLTPAQAALAAPPVSAASTLALLRDAGADFSGFIPDGIEQLEGQPCAVYSGDRATTVALLSSLAESGLPAADTQQIATAESRLTICPDGYLRRIETAFSGEQPDPAGGPARPYSYRLSVDLSGFDGSIELRAPVGARELPASPARPLP